MENQELITNKFELKWKTKKEDWRGIDGTREDVLFQIAYLLTSANDIEKIELDILQQITKSEDCENR